MKYITLQHLHRAQREIRLAEGTNKSLAAAVLLKEAYELLERAVRVGLVPHAGESRVKKLKKAAACLAALVMVWSCAGQLPYRTNSYFFAVTAYDAEGLEGDVSGELVFRNWQGGTNRFERAVTVGWDPVARAAGYHLWVGRQSRNYTAMIDTGPATEWTLAFFTNRLVTNVWTFSHPKGLQIAPAIDGPWAACANPLAVTNPPGPGGLPPARFFLRGVGSTNGVTKKHTIL